MNLSRLRHQDHHSQEVLKKTRDRFLKIKIWRTRRDEIFMQIIHQSPIIERGTFRCKFGPILFHSTGFPQFAYSYPDRWTICIRGKKKSRDGMAVPINGNFLMSSDIPRVIESAQHHIDLVNVHIAARLVPPLYAGTKLKKPHDR